MRGWLAALAASASASVTEAQRRSQGCSSGQLGSGRRMQQEVSAEGNTSPRKFLVTAPSNPSKEALPVLFFYHGWGNTPAEIADAHNFDALAEKHSFIAVYPEGMSDYKAENGNTDYGSWNLGSLSEAQCDPSIATGKGACYETCGHSCNACSWTTCSDDVAFTDAMVKRLSDDACVDMSRLYAYGESNGGMFVYKLLKERPNMLAAAVPEQGLPPWTENPLGQPIQASLLHLHDRKDAYVPLNGGLSEDGWKYTSLDATLRSACGGEAALLPVTTNMTGGSRAFDCTQRQGCAASEVVACAYDGEHGDLPDRPKGANDHGDEFVWNFLQKFTAPAPYVLGAPRLGRSDLLARKTA